MLIGLGFERNEDQSTQVIKGVRAIVDHVDNLLVVQQFIFNFLIILNFPFTFHLLFTDLILIDFNLLHLVIENLLSLYFICNYGNCRCIRLLGFWKFLKRFILLSSFHLFTNLSSSIIVLVLFLKRVIIFIRKITFLFLLSLTIIHLMLDFTMDFRGEIIDDSFFIQEVLPLLIETIRVLLLLLFNILYLWNVCILKNL